MVDVVMAVRKQPFREWVVVYYEPKKTDHAKMIARLKADGCPRARHEPAKPKKSRGVVVQIDNPVVTPGDCILVAVKLPKGRTGKATIVAPKKTEMRGARDRALKGGKRPTTVPLQTDRKSPLGKHAFKIKVKYAGKVLGFLLEVELVRKVG